MKIGQISIKSPYIQAPLAGYSCAPMRVLAQQWGQPGFCCSEMLSAKHIFSGAKQRLRYQYKDPREGLLCVQLSGSEPEHLARAVQTIKQWGADLVDLNCGCPMPKIRKKVCGSQLLQDPERLYRCVSAMKAASDLPVMVKIRVDGRSGDHYNQDVASAVQNAGADVLSVHGRHWTERYDTPAHWDDIAAIKQWADIPVIGNGDVADTSSAQALMAHTQCDAVMVARAAVGQPWLFAQIRDEAEGKTFTVPDRAEIGRMFVQHVKGLVALETEYPAMLQSRKLAKYYARGRLSEAALQDFFQVEDFASFERLVDKHFGCLLGVVPTALG